MKKSNFLRMEQHLTAWSRNNAGVFTQTDADGREKIELEIKDVIHIYPNKKTALNCVIVLR